jgi:hypothetical protein
MVHGAGATMRPCYLAGCATGGAIAVDARKYRQTVQPAAAGAINVRQRTDPVRRRV